jgi:integrase
MTSIVATKRNADGKPARDTKWRARWRDPNGRSRSRNFERKLDAQNHLDGVTTDMHRNEDTDPGLRRIRFDDWADEWWATSVHVQPSTRRGYRQALDHLRPAFGASPIGSLERADVKRWATEQIEAGYSSKTVRNWLGVAVLVFTEALEARAIRENPARGLKLPRTIGQAPLFFDADQVEALVRAIREPYGVLILFDAYTGLRPGEVAGLRVKRLDLVRGRVEVAETLTPVDGRLVEGPTKTYATRTVTLPPFLVERAAEYLAWLVDFQGRPLAPDDYVFRSPKGMRFNRQNFRSDSMRPGLERAGLPVAFRFHDLRHTCASLMIKLGAHPKLVQERLGHSDIGVTMNVYGHLFPSLHETMTDGLEGLYQGAKDAPWKPPAGEVRDLRPAVAS